MCTIYNIKCLQEEVILIFWKVIKNTSNYIFSLLDTMCYSWLWKYYNFFIISFARKKIIVDFYKAHKAF